MTVSSAHNKEDIKAAQRRRRIKKYKDNGGVFKAPADRLIEKKYFETDPRYYDRRNNR